MRRALLICFPLVLSVAAHAQTPGTPGVNDYWISPALGGGVSCCAVTVPATGPLVFHCSSTPFTLYAVFWSSGPCTACAVAGGMCGMVAPPTSLCPISNQFIELDLAGALVSLLGFTDAMGNATVSLPVPTLAGPIFLSSQAAFMNCGSFTVSQAWSVTVM